MEAETIMEQTGAEARAEMQARALVEAAAQFCRFAGGICYEGWPLATVRDYLLWHAQHDTVRIVQTFGTVTGVGVAWRARRMELREDGQKSTPFKWEVERGDEDVIFVAEVVASRPETFAGLVKGFMARFPDWETTPVWTYRYRQLTQMSVRTLRRAARGGELGQQNKRL